VADVDQITDDLRAQLHVIASDIGAFAIGIGGHLIRCTTVWRSSKEGFSASDPRGGSTVS
jgi:hypothetical protein